MPNDPIIQEILAGKTVLVDANVPLDKKEIPYKNLYTALAVRGLRLRMYIYDDIDKEIYRGLLMWAEPFVKVVACSRCGKLELTSEETKPSMNGCPNASRHKWRGIKQSDILEESEKGALQKRANKYLERSFNGRTSVSKTDNAGSNPARSASLEKAS